MYYHIDYVEAIGDKQHTGHLGGGNLALDDAVHDLLTHKQARTRHPSKSCLWSSGNAPLAVVSAKTILEVAERHNHEVLKAIGLCAKELGAHVVLDDPARRAQ